MDVLFHQNALALGACVAVLNSQEKASCSLSADAVRTVLCEIKHPYIPANTNKISELRVLNNGEESWD